MLTDCCFPCCLLDSVTELGRLRDQRGLRVGIITGDGGRTAEYIDYPIGAGMQFIDYGEYL